MEHWGGGYFSWYARSTGTFAPAPSAKSALDVKRARRAWPRTTAHVALRDAGETFDGLLLGAASFNPKVPRKQTRFTILVLITLQPWSRFRCAINIGVFP